MTAAGHWWRNLREPTHFDAAIRRMARDGWTTFLELGPHPALAAVVLEAVAGAIVAAACAGGARRRRSSPRLRRSS